MNKADKTSLSLVISRAESSNDGGDSENTFQDAKSTPLLLKYVIFITNSLQRNVENMHACSVLFDLNNKQKNLFTWSLGDKAHVFRNYPTINEPLTKVLFCISLLFSDLKGWMGMRSTYD